MAASTRPMAVLAAVWRAARDGVTPLLPSSTIAACTHVLEELGLEDEIPLASLAKRFEEVYVPGQADPVRLPRQSEALYLLLARVYVASNRHDQAIARLNAFVAQNKTVPAQMQLGLRRLF